MKRMGWAIIGLGLIVGSDVTMGKPGNGGGGGGGGSTTTVPDPSNLQLVDASESAFNISWQSGGEPTAGFLVEVGTSTPPTGCAAGADIGSATTYHFSGLESGTLYHIRVCAYDASAITSAGATLSATTSSPPVPLSPREEWRHLGSVAGDAVVFMKNDEALNRLLFAGEGAGGFPFIEARDPATGELDSTFGDAGRLDVNPGQTDNRIAGFALDSSGNSYLCGKGCFATECSPESGKGKNKKPDTTGLENPWTTKISPSGQILWTKAWNSDDSIAQEYCHDLTISNESGIEYLYVMESTYNRNPNMTPTVTKVDLNGNQVWQSVVEGQPVIVRQVDIMKVGADSLYLGATFIDGSYQLSKRTLTTGEVTSTYDGVDGYSDMPIAVGQFGGQESVWISQNVGLKLLRFDANLNPALGGCDGQSYGSYAVDIRTRSLEFVSSPNGIYLYAPAMVFHDELRVSADNGILRYNLTGGGCNDDNAPGGAFDFATHTVNIGHEGASDGVFVVASDAAGDVYTMGFYRIDTSNVIGQIIRKFSGQ